MACGAPTLPTWGTNAEASSGDTTPWADGSDAYANNVGAVISFQHLPSCQTVFFKAFITAFNETFSSDWSQESVYGRADPIYMFKQTKRNVNLAFKIPAGSHEQAVANLASVQRLAQFLYPSYECAGSATTITQSPLIRLKIINLLKNSATDVGLLGAIESIAIDHGLAAEDGVIEVQKGTILSKLIEVNLNFSAIHEHPLGWQDLNFSEPSFPYAMATTATEVQGIVTTGPGTIDSDDWAANDNTSAAATNIVASTPEGSCS